MITQNGKELIAKFLLGQAPAFATHIAIGVGARPGLDRRRTIASRGAKDGIVTLTSPGHGYRVGDTVSVTINPTTYNGHFVLTDTTKDTLSYRLDVPDNATVATTGYAKIAAGVAMSCEAARFPITSRGYVNEGGVTKMAFAAEMPTTERYLVSEVALWSAGSNANAKNVDSRQLYSFGLLEGWKYHHDATVENVPFRSFLASNPPDIDAAMVGRAFICPSDTPVMTNAFRANRYEPGRFHGHTIMLRGDSAVIESTSQDRNGILSASGDHVHLDTVPIDLSRQSPNDELKLGFSVVSRLAANATAPSKVRVVVEFLHSESLDTGYARMYGEFNKSDIDTNRYVVLRRRLADLETSGDFDWSKVRNVRIFASCLDAAGVPDKDSYVALDIMRFDNVSSPNPLYAMTGYTVFNDGSPSSPKPIYKMANTSNYVEFRANIGVI